MVNFNKASKMTKVNCPKLSKVNSNFLDFHGFRKREKEREKEGERERGRGRERKRLNFLQGSLFIPNF